MANLNHLCRSLLHAMDTGKRDLENHIVLQIRAALAQVEPEQPTVMEIIELANEIEAAELGQVDLVRAALARWGNL
jgi:hypothetical protein